mmetsp:Transcript_2490/g.3617  ORF Transcript_2490/g.3617 Transcript_2490/m.3617 type:complete len:678 (-) Transcript_2490:35-2068(-)
MIDIRGYKEIKEIGVGNYGRAILVKKNNLEYVIKRIETSDLTDDEKSGAMGEVDVLQMLDHPNIVKIFESFEAEGALHIVMEYADEGDLGTLLRNRKDLLDEDMISLYFIQIVLALKHVHERSILHRDLKTQNIFVTSKSTIKLGDFGIAKVLTSKTAFAKTMIGTPYYLSPELCEDQPYDQKSDVWALGCVLYELTTLKHAFDGKSLPALILKILRGKYPPIPDVYSDELSSLIDDMLQIDPKNRPSLDEVLNHPFISQTSASVFSQIKTLQNEDRKRLTKASLLTKKDPHRYHHTPQPHIKLSQVDEFKEEDFKVMTADESDFKPILSEKEKRHSAQPKVSRADRLALARQNRRKMQTPDDNTEEDGWYEYMNDKISEIQDGMHLTMKMSTIHRAVREKRKEDAKLERRDQLQYKLNQLQNKLPPPSVPLVHEDSMEARIAAAKKKSNAARAAAKKKKHSVNSSRLSGDDDHLISEKKRFIAEKKARKRAENNREHALKKQHQKKMALIKKRGTGLRKRGKPFQHLKKNTNTPTTSLISTPSSASDSRPSSASSTSSTSTTNSNKSNNNKKKRKKSKKKAKKSKSPKQSISSHSPSLTPVSNNSPTKNEKPKQIKKKRVGLKHFIAQQRKVTKSNEFEVYVSASDAPVVFRENDEGIASPILQADDFPVQIAHSK